MNLTLYHGRRNPSDDLHDWGFQGPVLQNVKSVHYTYITHILVTFTDPLTAEIYRAKFGLEAWDSNVLKLPVHEDLVFLPRFEDGNPAYFGDFFLAA
ncbi:hypothetical protein IZ6_25570 [Terrihabitans soli]|uniref:Uncharacterized protein n=1 Tax=Terrihabitans soli TaxID=708113 RepID=A0A6S6QX40_9HYPH|nr:hypothetical protein [Terrihabitans soli]BCJ91822.1 hypothetical protein IZ6_25570 [Terrihabitans soli]